MSYQEREIKLEVLEKHLRVLDSDEGIRIETGDQVIFINKTSRRYCIDISKDGHDEFLYMNDLSEVLRFLANKIVPSASIFLY